MSGLLCWRVVGRNKKKKQFCDDPLVLAMLSDIALLGAQLPSGNVQIPVCTEVLRQLLDLRPSLGIPVREGVWLVLPASPGVQGSSSLTLPCTTL